MKGKRESIWTAVAIAAFILATIIVVLWAPVWLGDVAGFLETGRYERSGGTVIVWPTNHPDSQLGVSPQHERLAGCFATCSDESCADECMRTEMNYDVRVLGATPPRP